MKGKFIGESSMGFHKGEVYNIRSDIKMVRKGKYPFCKDILCICIYDNNSAAWCPYQSLEAILKNWSFNNI